MYVRMYVCMHVCMYACMYVCVYVCMYITKDKVTCHDSIMKTPHMPIKLSNVMSVGTRVMNMLPNHMMESDLLGVDIPK